VLAVAVVPRFVLPAIVATPALGSSAAAACAGTTDKSPNPSEATATADTFFNEIVFTIFLSFKSDKRFSFTWLVRAGYSLAMSRSMTDSLVFVA
jgi:hypothetical protein